MADLNPPTFDEAEAVRATVFFQDYANAVAFLPNAEHIDSVVRLLELAASHVVAHSSFPGLASRMIAHLAGLRQDIQSLRTPRPTGKKGQESEKPDVTAARLAHLGAAEEAARQSASIANKLLRRVFELPLRYDLELYSYTPDTPIRVEVTANPFDEPLVEGEGFLIDVGPPMAVDDFNETIDEEIARRSERRNVEALDEFMALRSEDKRRNTTPKQKNAHDAYWSVWGDFLYFLKFYMDRGLNEGAARKEAKKQYGKYLEGTSAGARCSARTLLRWWGYRV